MGRGLLGRHVRLRRDELGLRALRPERGLGRGERETISTRGALHSLVRQRLAGRGRELTLYTRQVGKLSPLRGLDRKCSCIYGTRKRGVGGASRMERKSLLRVCMASKRVRACIANAMGLRKREKRDSRGRWPKKGSRERRRSEANYGS